MTDPTSFHDDPQVKLAHGRCQCGALRFALHLPSRWVAHCHCSMCRRAHAAAFVTWVSIDAERFEPQALDTLAWYRSSAEAERGFCRQCGTNLLFRSTRWPGEVHVARGAIDGPIDRAPQIHGFYDTRVPWFSVHDELPKRPPPAAAP